MASSLKSASATAGDHSTATDTTYGSGTSYDWVNLGNMASSNDTRAGSSGMTGNLSQTHRLDIKNWGFAIPSGATVDGVEAKIEWRVNNNLRPISELQIRLVKGGSPTGSNKAVNANTSSVDAVVTHGGSSDLWGATLSDTDVNATNFGIAIQYQSTSSSGKDVQIDHVTLEVFYTESGGSVESGAGTSAGSATASAVGASTAAAAGVSDGTSTASGVGASTAASVGTAAGTSTAAAVGSSSGGVEEGVGTAAGQATAAGVGASTAEAVGTAAGSSTASAVGTDAASQIEAASLAGLRVHAAREAQFFFSKRRPARRISRPSWPLSRAA